MNVPQKLGVKTKVGIMLDAIGVARGQLFQR